MPFVPRMHRRSLRALVLLSVLVINPFSSLPACADESLEPIAEYDAFAKPLLNKYCSDCHSGTAAESGFAVEQLRGGDDFQVDRHGWIDVVRRLRAGDMPPADMDQPTAEEREQLVDWIAAKLDSVDCSGEVNPGRVTLRRLNREQYHNTVRDLLGVDYDPDTLFPPDELAYGFDNNGDVLAISPLLFEKYLTAAGEVASRAVPTAEQLVEGGKRLKLRGGDGIADYGDGSRILMTDAKLTGKFEAERSGRHAMRVTVSGMQAGEDPVRMELWLDDQRFKQVNVWSNETEAEVFVALFDVSDGNVGENEEHEIGVAFVNDYYNERTEQEAERDRNLIVHKIEVHGPLRLADEAPAIARRLLLSKEPTPRDWREGDTWQSIARDRLRALVPRAYRRTVDDNEIDRLIALMETSREAGDSYHRALQLAVQAVLVSPRFLLVGDIDANVGATDTSDGIESIDEFALASRLSYFLWGTMPDDELLALADRDTLRDRLDAQVKRMLRDARVRHLATSFAGQWLETRQLASIRPDPDKFPEYDDELRSAMTREAEKFFEAVVVQDMPVTTLLDADFTFLNERLAQHYGIEGVKGDYFRQVMFSDDQRASGRGGLLGMASVLTVTSNPDRTSPVLRGKFVLANLLGDEPPPPPANVPALVDEGVAAHASTIREQLEVHRSDPGCAACHQQMDPLGFALESFDAIGRLRGSDGGLPIDDHGQLPDGTEFRGAKGLRELLTAREAQFRRALAEKLLTYALGRGLEYYDQCALREIDAATAADGDRFSAMVLAIANSRPFLFENLSR